MTALEALKRSGLLNWQVLLVGLENGWSQKTDLIQFAQDFIERSDKVDEDVAAIALGESLSKEDLALQVVQYLKSRKENIPEVAQSDARDKWRFGFLIALLESDKSDEEKVAELQELYGQFGFPDDMSSCSIYSNDGVDPLKAARVVAQGLEKNFHCVTTAQTAQS
jgi:hypothetical protein